MKANLLYALLAILFLSSGCSFNDKDPEPDKTYLLQRKYSEVIFPNGGGGTIDLTYTYDDNNLLTRISGVTFWKGELKTIYTKLAYDSKGRAEQINTLSGTEWVLFYNDKDQLVKVTRAYLGSMMGSYMHYYDDKGRLSEIKFYSGALSEGNLSNHRVFSYPGANQIKIAIQVGNEKTSEYTLLTDDKKRNLPALPHQISSEFFSEELMSEGIITQHNIISYEQLVFNKMTGTGNITGPSYQTEFTYNDGGYPSTCVRTFQEGSIQKVTYTYAVK
ncbi:hypothetical protein [Pontibacter sp. HSC-36F09]|uniref:hypothetical protein n=1 Tax=Pontibacter sp. HSC-36F09 TaxID=2910966 RepID=UPI00209E1AD3|nr:hypothetical protein [Pontibacter sp. HSC-36F09]MCP2044293.1 hypothetical protein [Pontibacter sp. HSC-36F09]